MNQAVSNNHLRPVRPGNVVALALASMLALVGCSSTTTIHPTYKPGAPAGQSATSGNLALRIVDKIDNKAPLAHQTTGLERSAKIAVFGPVFGSMMQDVDTGQLLVSETGPYKLDETPAIVSQRVFRDALARRGLRLVDGGEDVLEIQLLRFEYVLGTRKGESKVKAIANLLLRASFQRRGELLTETSVLEQGEKSFGWAMTPGDIEAFVSETLSKAAEHTLSDEKLSSIFNQSRAGTR